MSKGMEKRMAGMAFAGFLETIHESSMKLTLTLRIQEITQDGTLCPVAERYWMKLCAEQDERIVEIGRKEDKTAEVRLTDLEPYMYQISLCDEQGHSCSGKQAVYYVNGVQVEEACVDGTGCMKAEVSVVLQQDCSLLHICAQEHTSALVIALWDEKGCEQTICLGDEDGWEKSLPLPCGCYEAALRQREGSCSFCFDGRMLKEGEAFCLSQGEHELQLFACEQEEAGASLTLELSVRSADGSLCLPLRGSCFQIRVASLFFDEIFELNQENAYCLSLQGLRAGSYSVHLLQGPSGYDTTYIVNDREECDSAQLSLCEGGEGYLQILLTKLTDLEQELEAPLRICKYVRYQDGRMCRPRSGEVFKVMVQGCGKRETFLLNAGNNFCVDIADLCPGSYEIKELGCGDYVTTYQVNEEMEKTSACVWIGEYGTSSVRIINEVRNRGCVRISKYIRNECGELVKPQEEECFYGWIASCFCRYDFELNASNNWCVVFDDLHFGSYEVRECAEGVQVSYLVDGVKQTHARIVVDDCHERQIRIINALNACRTGELCICKYEETRCKELVKPQQDAVFEVEVKGGGFYECYRLHQDNDWRVVVRDLPQGEYRIAERAGEEYDAFYLVNREAVQEAVVQLKEKREEVVIVNRRKENGNLCVEVQIEDCDGSLRTPKEQECFEVLVESVKKSWKLCLCAENHWRAQLYDIARGGYRVIQKDTYGYRVSYELHGCRQSFARFRMEREDLQVRIINQRTDCTRTLTITKAIRGSDGQLMRPCKDSAYEVLVKGQQLCERYVLKEANDFCIVLSQLQPGYYQVEECGEEPADYLVNGKPCREEGIDLRSSDACVDIINEEQQSKPLCIRKRILCDGQLLMPKEDACYRVLLRGGSVHELLQLDAQNAFCAKLYDLPYQRYEISEWKGRPLHYEINGTPQKEGSFCYDGKEVDAVIVNEAILPGGLKLTAWVQCGGRWQLPDKDVCYEVLLSGEKETRRILLQEENDFCVQLYDLAPGHYELREASVEQEVSYEINHVPCSHAIIDLYDQDVSVALIHHGMAETAGAIRLHGCIEENGVRRELKEETIRLQLHANDLQREITLCAGQECSLTELPMDAYTLSAKGEHDVCFEVNGEVFQEAMCVELGSDSVDITVVEKRKTCFALRIQKWLLDDEGGFIKPAAADHFSLTLCHGKEQQDVVLDASNAFTACFPALPKGSYTLQEPAWEGAVWYQINDNEWQKEGSFELHQDSVIHVLNEGSKQAQIQLDAKLQGEDGGLEELEGHVLINAALVSQETSVTCVLKKENSWQAETSFPKGPASLHVESSQKELAFTVLVNGSRAEGELMISGHMSIRILCRRRQKKEGELLLQKVMRAPSCDCFRLPQPQERFEILLSKDMLQHTVTLDKDNGWKARVSHLEQGLYTIRELGSGNEVSYMIDGGMEQQEGRVEVDGRLHHVKIINEEKQQPKGSIELCKLLQQEDGCFVCPQEESFAVLLRHEQQVQRIVLNKENHFYTAVNGLEDGWYEIEEEGSAYDTSYIVNSGAPSKKGIVHVEQNANTVTVVNTPKQEKGSIALAKYIREDGVLKRPQSGHSYVFHVSGVGFNQFYTLEESNSWMMRITDLKDGMYVISETTTADAVSYIVNGGSECDQAVVAVKHNSNTVQIINTIAAEKKGSITLEKYIRTADGLKKPQAPFAAVIHVSRPGFNEQYRLSSENDWTQTLEELEDGVYVIDEAGEDKAGYIVNGGSECACGIVDVQGNANIVQIIDPEQTSSGMLELTKLIRQGNGSLMRPVDGDVFRIELSSGEDVREIVLNNGNGFHATLTDLPLQEYALKEIGNESFATTYRLNGGQETEALSVRISEQPQTVEIINERLVNRNTMEIFKYMLEENGSFVPPQEGEVFYFELLGQGVQERYELNAANSWHVTLESYPDGEYEVRETGSSYQVRYFVNSSSLSDTAHFQAEAGKTNIIGIINYRHSVQSGSIRLEKRMLGSGGEIIRPGGGDAYLIEVSSTAADFKQLVTLDKENDYRELLQNLPYGTYRVREIEHEDVLWEIYGNRVVKEATLQIDSDAVVEVLALNPQGAAAATMKQQEIHIVF